MYIEVEREMSIYGYHGAPKEARSVISKYSHAQINDSSSTFIMQSSALALPLKHVPE